MKRIHSTVCAILFYFTMHAQGTWTQKTNFAGSARDGGTAFAIGNYGYLATGYSTGNEQDLWQYNPTNDSWTQKANLPSSARRGAVSFAIGNKGYLMSGWDGMNYFQDLWEYDPSNDSWTSRANFPGSARNYSVAIAVGSKAYIGTGNDGSPTNDFWEYDPSNDTWIQKTNFPGGLRDHATGFCIANKAYIGTGYDGSNYKSDFWEYDPSNDSWLQKSNFAGGPRFAATGFAIGLDGYVVAGYDGTYYQDLWQYDIIADTWIPKLNFTGTSRGWAVGFTIGSTAYIGTGNDGVRMQDFWSYTPSTTWTPCSSVPSVTYGIQTYNTVQIGTQCWFKENLNFGSSVADVTQETNNSIIEKTCYNNSNSNCNTYGGIYSWDEAMQYGTNQQGICPNGWHIPTQSDFQTLIAYLGSTTAGEQMKVTSSDNPSWDGNNISRFTALPGGIGQGSSFMYLGSRETFWSSTQLNSTDAYDYDLSTGNSALTEANNAKVSGYCIRCIQDNTSGIHSISGKGTTYSLYPNPAHSTINFQYFTDETSDIELKIYDYIGKVIFTTQTKHQSRGLHKFEFDAANLVNGLYVLNINVSGYTYFLKFVKD